MTKSHSLDVDIRFLLANERTLLAWVRTALTLQAGGIALTHFLSDTLYGIATGITMVLLGALLAVIGYRRFRAADRAIREDRLPELGKGPAFEIVLIIVIAVALAAVQVRDLL